MLRKKMIKKILTIIGLSSCLLVAKAEKQYMTVVQKNGSKISFSLEWNPIVTYESGNLVVNGNANTTYAISGVKNYHFTEKNETGVKAISKDELRIVSIDETSLQVQNAPSSENVALVNASGVVVFSTTTANDGSVIVRLPEQKGVYVLSIGAKSIKIIRK